MNENESYVLQEVNPKSNLTPEQTERLRVLDIWVDEMIVTMEEGKEYGVWGSLWRHRERTEHPKVTRL